MAGAPLPTALVAGNYYSIYDAYYRKADPGNKGSIGAIEAASLLKKSGLPDAILSKIWDLADSNSKGYLTKAGFFIALKLVATVQSGKEVSTSNLTLDVPPPYLGDSTISTSISQKKMSIPTETVAAPAVVALSDTSDWAMKPTERMKYDQLFHSLHPVDGFLPGNKVKGLLLDSKLSTDTLGKIWDLADADKDGALNQHEFSVAMHLVYKALEKYAIPSVLPVELLPAGQGSNLPASVTFPANVIPIVSAVSMNGSQVANSSQVAVVSKSIPQLADKNPIQIASTETTTACSWVVGQDEKVRYDLLFEQADVDKDGFVSGQEVKNVFLQSGVAQSVLAHIWNLCDTNELGKLNKDQFALAMWLITRKLKGLDPPQVLMTEMIPPSCRPRQISSEISAREKEAEVYINPELEALAKQVQEYTKERCLLEMEIEEKTAENKIKNREATSLHGELEMLTATYKQLESQKFEASKRISDLKVQVDKLKVQAEEQEVIVKAQESEAKMRREEMESLKKEEETAKGKFEDLQHQLEVMNSAMIEIDKLIERAAGKMKEMRDAQNQVQIAIENFDTVIKSEDITVLSESYLHLAPDFHSYNDILNAVPVQVSENSNQPRESTGINAFGSTVASDTPFVANFDDNSAGFVADPFGSSDPFGDKSYSAKFPKEDPFGCDPFAILHAPPKSGIPSPLRSESPSPALPPKKSKQPPPRPAPPRPAPPSSTTSFEPNFADFADFNSKVANEKFNNTLGMLKAEMKEKSKISSSHHNGRLENVMFIDSARW